MIPVTKPFLPPRHEYEQYVQGIWERNWLTNNGPLVVELENRLSEYLGTPNILYLNNGTIALQIAIKALELKGEIITTPFSYVATTSTIVWEGCDPVFVDIDPNTLNIDPSQIESAITAKTSAILATHVFGNPCDITAIEEIASRNNIKVIYDAAHAFGTKYKGRSVYQFGDVSTASFHSTKLFHTIEGGAVFSNDEKLIRVLSFMRNFGHIGEDYKFVGINAKNSEFHAAMGLSNLKYIEAILAERKRISDYYDAHLNHLPHTKQVINANCEYNYAYYPIILKSEKEVLSVIESLNRNNIYPRRYFYPSLNTLPYVNKADMQASESISKRILCLPLYHDLSSKDIDNVVSNLVRVF